MKMMKLKKGFANLRNPGAILTGIIVAVLAVLFLGATIGLLINATVDLSNVPNMPLSQLFAAGGVVLLLIGAGVIFLFIKFFKVGGGR